MKAQKNPLRISVVFAVFAALAVFTFTDLEISILLFSKGSLFGLFFDAFGAWPAPFFGLLASAAAFSTRPPLLRFKRVYSALFLFLAAAAGTITIYLPFHYAYRARFAPAFAVPGVMLALLAILLFQKLPVSRYTAVRIIACAVILTILSELLTIAAIKHFWGRVRFRDMEAPFLAFTPWFRLNGPTGGTSFPSGHTGNAAVSFTIFYLRHLKAKGGISPVLAAAPVLWTGLVALSRIVLGFHFATDVLFGAGVSIAFTLLFDRFIKRRLKKARKE